MVEAVLVIPVLMLLLVVLIQFALWAHAAQVAQLAASEGDRAARSSDGSGQAGVARAEAILRGPGSDVQGGTATYVLLPADQAQVTVVGRSLELLPGLDLPVSSTDVGPVQEFRSSE